MISLLNRISSWRSTVFIDSLYNAGYVFITFMTNILKLFHWGEIWKTQYATQYAKISLPVKIYNLIIGKKIMTFWKKLYQICSQSKHNTPKFKKWMIFSWPICVSWVLSILLYMSFADIWESRKTESRVMCYRTINEKFITWTNEIKYMHTQNKDISHKERIIVTKHEHIISPTVSEMKIFEVLLNRVTIKTPFFNGYLLMKCLSELHVLNILFSVIISTFNYAKFQIDSWHCVKGAL